MKKALVIKIGGNIIDDEQALKSFLYQLAAIDMPKILVHGGGKLATELSKQLGLPTTLVDGRRITDEATLKVVTMTYAGWINKTITAQLQSLGCNAMGLCGADAKLLPAVKRTNAEIDYGWVGDMDSKYVNTTLLQQLLDIGLTLIIAPISADAQGHLLNVNADTVARTLAQALSQHYNTTLIYCFEKKGLLLNVDDENSLIPKINEAQTKNLKATGAISKGMIPKIDNALGAVKQGVNTVIIGHAMHISAMAQKQKGYGTYILA